MSGPLALIPSIHVVEENGMLRVDEKFLEGLALHRNQWGGDIRLLIRRGTAKPPFSRLIAPQDMPCDLRLLDMHEPVTASHLQDVSVVLASADDHRQLALAAPCKAAGAKLVYAVEYDLWTRLRIARLDNARKPLRLLRSWQWLLMQERLRRRSMRAGDALQTNGYPAAEAYGRLTDDLCLFLDGRMRIADMARPEDMAARKSRRGPLRLVHAGRLEPMKGAQDLVPFMKSALAAGMDITLDVFGAGQLRDEIAKGAAGLGGKLRVHDPLPFQEGLVPFMRQHADMFLAMHRQSDPSCMYLEAMGCGLPVLGADNAMWRPLCQHSNGGWIMPMGQPDKQVAALARLDQSEIISAGGRALEFAREHDFESQFALRMDHLRSVAGI